MRQRKHIGILLALSVLAGCETLPPKDPEFAPVEPADLRPPVQNSGSIYQSGYDMRLFDDHTARRVGDVITVKLVERTVAEKDADMDIDKQNSVTVEVPTLFGVANKAILGNELETSLASQYEFSGAGESNQSNRLTGDLSVTVIEVLPNGNLKVRGEKRVTLNQGSEYVRLSGIIRPVDIDTANIVLSTKVADATIMYTGDGAMADASKPGWFTRFFLSWIFPF
ncbi:MAG: flagellar basal body L-ring protein FlgH [Gammaproteobacteria bacterium]